MTRETISGGTPSVFIWTLLLWLSMFVTFAVCFDTSRHLDQV
jgi:hypothetical protein